MEPQVGIKQEGSQLCVLAASGFWTRDAWSYAFQNPSESKSDAPVPQATKLHEQHFVFSNTSLAILSIRRNTKYQSLIT